MNGVIQAAASGLDSNTEDEPIVGLLRYALNPRHYTSGSDWKTKSYLSSRRGLEMFGIGCARNA